MTYEPSSFQIPELYYTALFEAMPGCNVLVRNDPPRFTILAATPAYLKQTGYTKEAMIGKGVFDAFPVNQDPQYTGGRDLLASYTHVALQGEPHYLPVQRYDLQNSDGSFTEKYWRISNTPVFSPTGAVAYIIHTAEDITERVQARKEKERLKGIEQAHHVFLQAPLVIGILRGNRHVVELVNQEGLRFWNKTEAIVGRPLLEAIPELRGQAVYEAIDRVFHTGELYQASAVPITSVVDGKEVIKYFDLYYKPLYDEGSPSVSGVFTISNEVSEKVRAQKALEENEAVLQRRVAERTAALEEQKRFMGSILEASLDGIYALRAVRNTEGAVTDFRYLFANNNTATLLHRSVEEIVGASMLTLIPENRSNGFFDLFDRLLQSGEAFQDETHFVTQNIDSWYRFVIVPLDRDTLVVSIEDITEKKQGALQIEAQRNLLDSILKNSSNGISVSRALRDEAGEVVDARTIMANDAAVNYIGLPKEDYLSKTATQLEPNITSSPYYQQCVHTLRTGAPFMMQYLTESTGRWLEVTVSKLDDEHLIHVFTDVTPIKQAQLQLERSVEDLKRSNKNLEEFAYAASHDLKEPVRKIHFFADRLKDSLGERLSPGERAYLERMEVASSRMNTLIEDLLTYSALSQQGVEKEVVDLNELMDQVVSDLDLEIEQRGAVISVPELFTLEGHRWQLQQAFQNVIGNALKYCKPSTAPVITVSCSKLNGWETDRPLSVDEGAKDYYLIRVSDNGIGFDPADAERIFNVFTRLHGRTEYKGTGVGLSIVRKVIENHQGRIWAESQPGEGSVFNIILPAV